MVLMQSECGNVARRCRFPVNAPSRVNSISRRDNITVVSSAQGNAAANQASATTCGPRSSFFSHSACKVVSAAARTAPQRHGLPRIDTTCAPAPRATRDVEFVDALATPIISYPLFARANPSCGGSIFSVAELPPRSWRQLEHFVERRAINDSTPKL